MKVLLPLALVAAAGAAHAGDVTVIRPRSIIAEEWSYYILVGSEQPIADLRSGERVTFRVPPGPSTFVVHCPAVASGHYEESSVDYVFRDSPAYFVIEPAPHCVSIRAVEGPAAATHIARTHERSIRPLDYEKPVAPPKKAKAAAQAQPVAAAPAPGAAATDAIAAATRNWVEAFNSREPARLTALYDTDAVLLDLDARSPVSGSAAIARHYAGVSQRPTARVALGERSIRILGETAIDSGTATLFEMRDGNATTTPLRYSLTYRNRGGQWLIVDHQLSPAPR